MGNDGIQLADVVLNIFWVFSMLRTSALTAGSNVRSYYGKDSKPARIQNYSIGWYSISRISSSYVYSICANTVIGLVDKTYATNQSRREIWQHPPGECHLAQIPLMCVRHRNILPCCSKFNGSLMTIIDNILRPTQKMIGYCTIILALQGMKLAN